MVICFIGMSTGIISSESIQLINGIIELKSAEFLWNNVVLRSILWEPIDDKSALVEIIALFRISKLYKYLTIVVNIYIFFQTLWIYPL